MIILRLLCLDSCAIFLLFFPFFLDEVGKNAVSKGVGIGCGEGNEFLIVAPKF